MSPAARTVLAVDPGVAATGVVLLVGGRIMEAYTYKTERVDDSFTDVLRRVQEQCHQVKLLAADQRWWQLHIALESYEDFGPHLRGAKNRWMTPMLLPLLDMDLRGHGVVHWQSPKTVLTATRAYREHWEAGRRGLVPGDALLTNEHLRSAACHGLHLDGLLRQKRGAA
ncbi:MAG: hypothetical protein ACYC6T_08135 [Thermoleophilia bacterium]